MHMNYVIIGVINLLAFTFGCKAQHLLNKSKLDDELVKDSVLLNIRDSILIGRYSVSVKGHTSVHATPINPLKYKVFVKGFENAEKISLKALKQNVELLSSNSLLSLQVGSIALLKIKKADASTLYEATSQHLKSIPKIDILEEGDIIVFVGWRSYDDTGMHTHPVRWHMIVK